MSDQSLNLDAAHGGDVHGRRAAERYRLDDLIVDAGTGRVTRDDVEIALPRLSYDLLLALCRVAPAILSVDELMDRVWPGLVVTPETVSQRVKLLRDALGDDAHHPRYVAGVRGRGYRLAAAAKPLEDRRSDASPSAIRPQKALWSTLVAVAFLAVGVWLFAPSLNDGTHDPATWRVGSAIAVLPFTVRAAQGEAPAFFADGLHDDLLTRLTGIANLRVISRSSVMPYRDSEKSLRQIGTELGVDTLLEGSVQQVGNHIRINAQLIDVTSDQHLWAQTFDRQLTVSNLLAIQSEMAGAIASALRVVAVPEATADAGHGETDNLAAYSALLAGHEAMSTFLSRDGGFDLLAVAEDRFRRALSLDPNYARAYAGLAEALFQRSWTSGLRPVRPQNLIEGRLAAERALALAPGLADAHLALAQYHYYGFRDYDAALSELQRAEARLPGNARIAVVKGWILLRMGKAEEALSSMQRAVVLDPRNLVAHVNLARVLLDLRRYDALAIQLQRMLSIDSGHGVTLRAQAALPLLRSGDITPLMDYYRTNQEADFTVERWRATLLARDWDAALTVANALPGEEEASAAQRAAVQALTTFYRQGSHAAGGALAAARDRLQGVLADSPDDQRMTGWLAMVLAGLGEHDAALAAARDAAERMPLERDAIDGYEALDTVACVAAMVGDQSLALASLERLLSNPGFASIHLYRSDPRFESLADTAGFKALVTRFSP